VLSSGCKVLLGVSGGIAAYKSADLVRRLRAAGCQVRVVLTAAAEQFVSATTFQALSGEAVRSSLWDHAAEAAMGHIELARWADCILIAPASADRMAKLAHGFADDLLGTLVLASAAPLVLAPAMNQQMWAHPATVHNLAVLKQRGARVIGPESGAQACGDIGPGRMSEPETIVRSLFQPGRWHGQRVVITAGPTFEDLDPVRFIGNRSSGRMGYAIACAAAKAGAQTILISGPTALPVPLGVQRIAVRSALQMLAAASEHAPGAGLFVATAAVADYRPLAVAAQKIKRCSAHLHLELVPNPDIVAQIAKSANRPRFVLGFAAETEQLESHARGKLARKNLDAVAANRVDDERAFDREDNELLLIDAQGSQLFARMPKTQLATELLDAIADRMGLAVPDALENPPGNTHA